jgi:hypothetical protein
VMTETCQPSTRRLPLKGSAQRALTT